MKNIYLLLYLLLFISACSKKESSNDNPVPTGKNQLSEVSYIIDTNSVVSINETSVVISKSQGKKYKTGDILIASPSINAPYGFMRKVIDVSESTTEINYTTDQASLNEAFEELYINYSYTDTPSYNASFRTGPNLTIDFNNYNGLINGLNLTGRIRFNTSINFQYIKKPGRNNPLPEKVLIDVSYKVVESTLEIKNSNDQAITILSEKTLISFPLPDLFIPVGPVLVNFAQRVDIKVLPFSISGKMKISVDPKISGNIGALYENSSFTTFGSYAIESNAKTPSLNDFSSSASLVAKMTVFKPVYELKPYHLEILKFFFELPNDLEFENSFTSKPNYTLKYKLKATGGVREKFWIGRDKEYSLSIPLIDKTILQGNWTSDDESVNIGSQVWMKKNLDVTTYRNGDPITQVTDSAQWVNMKTGAWCYYQNDPANGAIYGKLYNWYAVNDPRGLAPTGWHIPSNVEWNTLTDFLGGQSVAGGKMKVTGTSLWKSPNADASNSSGFSGLPGGARDLNGYGGFGNIGYYSRWWSSTEANTIYSWYRGCFSSSGDVLTFYDNKANGYSVRCIKD